MTNKEAIEMLSKHNAWRRGEHPYDKNAPHPMPVNPSELGMAMEHAIEVLRADTWHDIETVPAASKVILYSPHRCISNPERVEVDYGDNGAGSYHSWATHWRPLPQPPQKGE